jgi:predicted nucleotidyltransferase
MVAPTNISAKSNESRLIAAACSAEGVPKSPEVSMMVEQRGISDFRNTLRQHLPLLEERYGVASLGLFGSHVRHEASGESDLDVLVRFRQVPGLIRFIELENYLSDLLGVRVDLVMAEALKPSIGARVPAEVVPV